MCGGLGAHERLGTRGWNDRDGVAAFGADGVTRCASLGADGKWNVGEGTFESRPTTATADGSAESSPAASRPSAASRPTIAPGALTVEGDVTGDGVSDLLILRRIPEHRLGWDLLVAAG